MKACSSFKPTAHLFIYPSNNDVGRMEGCDDYTGREEEPAKLWICVTGGIQLKE